MGRISRYFINGKRVKRAAWLNWFKEDYIPSLDNDNLFNALIDAQDDVDEDGCPFDQRSADSLAMLEGEF